MKASPVSPGAWQWVANRTRKPEATPHPHARLIIGAVFASLVLIAALAVLAVDRILGEFAGGPRISITNQCGHDLYADDGRDGLPIEAGQTILWASESESGDKTLRLWWSSTDAVNGVEGRLVQVHGDSVLSGAQCP